MSGYFQEGGKGQPEQRHGAKIYMMMCSKLASVESEFHEDRYCETRLIICLVRGQPRKSFEWQIIVLTLSSLGMGNHS